MCAWPLLERELAREGQPVHDAAVIAVTSPVDATTLDATTPDATMLDATTPDAAVLVDAPPSPAGAIVAKAKQLAADGKVGRARPAAPRAPDLGGTAAG